MPKYYESKQEAQDAGHKYEEHFDIKLELEPSNGWVIVLVPRSKEVFRWPLYELLTEVEIDLAKFARLSERQGNYRAPQKVHQDKPRRPPSSPPAAPPPPPAASAPVAPPAPPPPPPGR